MFEENLPNIKRTRGKSPQASHFKISLLHIFPFPLTNPSSWEDNLYIKCITLLKDTTVQNPAVGVLYHRCHCTQDIPTNSAKHCPVMNRILPGMLGDEIVPHRELRSGGKV